MDMDTHSSASAKLTATGVHRREEELRKVRLVWFGLLTVTSGLEIYVFWGDLVSVASIGVAYVAFGLLLWPANGGRRWLGSVICVLMMSFVLLEVSMLARTLESLMLAAAVGAAAMLVGGGCVLLLHRRISYVLDPDS